MQKQENSCHIRCFVGSYGDADLLSSVGGISPAAYYYQKRLVETIEPEECTWLLPLPLFSERIAKQIIVNTNKKNNSNWFPRNVIFRLSFLCLPPLIQQLVHQYLAPMPGPKVVWVYNSEFNNIIFIIRLFFARKKIFIILADTSPSGIHSFFTRFGLFLCCSYISLSSVGLRIFPCKQPFHFPGIAERTPPELNFIDISTKLAHQLPHNLLNLLSDTTKPIVMLSGSLGFSTGIQLLADTAPFFPEVIFLMTGKPYCITHQELLNCIGSHHNIYYLGLLPKFDYQILLKKSCLGLSLRMPLNEHNFNFPSKILEYLSYGLPVISSLDYGLPSPPVFVCNSYDKVSLSHQIKSVLKLERHDLSVEATKLSSCYSSANFLASVRSLESRDIYP